MSNPQRLIPRNATSCWPSSMNLCWTNSIKPQLCSSHLHWFTPALTPEGSKTERKTEKYTHHTVKVAYLKSSIDAWQDGAGYAGKREENNYTGNRNSRIYHSISKTWFKAQDVMNAGWPPAWCYATLSQTALHVWPYHFSNYNSLPNNWNTRCSLNVQNGQRSTMKKT